MKHGRSDYQHIQDKTGKIPENEPVFLIRGQDKISGAVVRHWAKLHDAAKGDPRCSDQARILAREMDNWPTKKIADYPGARPEEGKFIPTIPPDEIESDNRNGEMEEALKAAVNRIHELEEFLRQARADLAAALGAGVQDAKPLGEDAKPLDQQTPGETSPTQAP